MRRDSEKRGAFERMVAVPVCEPLRAAWVFVCYRQRGMADIDVAKISEDVHGPLLKALAKRANYFDIEAIELFRTGAPIVGRLDR